MRKASICILAMLLFVSYVYADENALAVKHWQNKNVISRYDVFEITFQHDQVYDNPFFDVSVEASFVSPNPEIFRVDGFHYGSLEKAKINKEMPADGKGRPKIEYVFDKANIWKVRFAPWVVGKWKYYYTFSNSKGETARGEGEFECVEGDNHGFVRQDPDNPFLWVFDDGSPYYPIGLQDGVFDNEGLGTVLANWAMEESPSDRIGRDSLIHLRERCLTRSV